MQELMLQVQVKKWRQPGTRESTDSKELFQAKRLGLAALFREAVANLASLISSINTCESTVELCLPTLQLVVTP